MEKQWVLRPADETVCSHLAGALNLPAIVARLLVQRGYGDPALALRFLASTLREDLPSPFLMADMEAAAERVLEAVKNKERIAIWGDYDVDGTTGAATLINFFREIGAEPLYHIPHRIEEGYGLNKEGLKQLAENGVRVAISVDCGISNYAEVEFAKNAGLDFIIVDHHQPPDPLPPAYAILNPHRRDCSFPDKGLCGAGLAFYLVIGIRAKLREASWYGGELPDVRKYLDVVTLGTIADMVPLTGANRVLTKRGLAELSESKRPGIVALKNVAGMPPGNINAGQVGFQLGPRINAAGRMDAGIKVVELLTTDSPEIARRIAEELNAHNKERREAEAQVLEAALEQFAGDPLGKDRYSIVLGADGWHPGVLGIVASRVLERFYRPTVIVSFTGEDGKGSARSIRGFNIVEGFRRCSELLEKFGGHEFAGGLSIKREKFASFCEQFEEAVRSALNNDHLLPLIEIDSTLDFSDIGFELSRRIDSLKPFGIGNPEPVFLSQGAEVVERKEFNGGVRLKLRQRNRILGAVLFGSKRTGAAAASDKSLPELLALNAKLDVVYRLTENEWNGTIAPELRILDGRTAE